MIRIVLAGVAGDLRQVFADATGNTCLSLPRPQVVDGSVDLMDQLNGLPAPDVVVLDARTDAPGSLELARLLTWEYPLEVLLVTDQPDALGLAAMRAGVRDLVPATADSAEVRRALDAIVPTAARRAAGWANSGDPQAAPRPMGRVITFASPKGGVGKTITSTNLAVALSQAAPHSTVIVDLDLQFGDVATALNLTPEFSVANAVQGPASRDTMVLKTYLARHSTGLYVLPAPDHPAAADDITGGEISHLLEMLATEFRYVIVDTSPGLNDHTLAALDRTTDLVLMTALSVPGVRGLRKVIDTLNTLRMYASQRHVVVNFADAGGGMSRADVEATLDTSVSASLPTSKAALASINVGVPLMESGRRDPFVKALKGLAESFLPQRADGKRRRPRQLAVSAAR